MRLWGHSHSSQHKSIKHGFPSAERANWTAIDDRQVRCATTAPVGVSCHTGDIIEILPTHCDVISPSKVRCFSYALLADYIDIWD